MVDGNEYRWAVGGPGREQVIIRRPGTLWTPSCTEVANVDQNAWDHGQLLGTESGMITPSQVANYIRTRLRADASSPAQRTPR